jgi:fatty acid desaturase
MPHIESDRSTYLGIDVSKATIQRLSSKDPWVATAKVAAYFILIIAFVAIYCVTDNDLLQVLCVIMLGVAYAHGVELQHEALHGNLFANPVLNRVIGFLTGAPMLVSYTQYRAYHLHHHRCVGTSKDEELFDYTARSLTNPLSAFVRMWNLIKIPAFLVTFLGMLQGDYPDKVNRSDRRALLVECTLLFMMLGFALSSPFFLGDHLLMLWIVPWLAVAEPLHFMVEVPEHIGCDRRDRSMLRNTRSYTTNPVWAWLTNFNNFHIEHHLFPTVPAHRLGILHARTRGAQGHCTDGYWKALQEVSATVRHNPEH